MGSENLVAGNSIGGIDDSDASGNSNDTGGIEIGRPIRVDPGASVAAERGDGNDSTAGDGRKRRSDAGKSRGKYGTRTRTAASAPSEQKIHVDVITRILLSLHSIAATKIPEMALTEAEAQTVAKAYQDVAEFYPVLQQTAKAAAWTELISALGFVYGMRAVAIYNNRKNNTEPGAEKVIPFPNRQPPQS